MIHCFGTKSVYFISFLFYLVVLPFKALCFDARNNEIIANTKTTILYDDSNINESEFINHNNPEVGNFCALIIGINDYQDEKISDLKTPVADIKAIAEVLQKNYGFQIDPQKDLLINRRATRETIINSLRRLAASARPSDNVLIYFAGHGALDKLYNDGWWLPADARADAPSTYIDNIEIQKAMKNMRAQHVLLISDSCYSGTLFGESRAMPTTIDNNYYLGLFKEKSRWGMTSGNKTPVEDSGTEGHSLFAYQLLKALHENNKPFVSTQDIYARIAPVISKNSSSGQVPICKPMLATGDQGGQFIFIAANNIRKTVTSPFAIKSNIRGTRVYVDERYLGSTPMDTLQIPAGSHKLRLEKEGFTPYERRILIADNTSQAYEVFLQPKALLNGRVSVLTTPEDVHIKILNVSRDFSQGMTLPPGEYQLEVKAEWYEPHQRSFILTPGENKTLSVRLKRTGPPKKLTNSLGMTFVYIPSGTFVMGSNKNEDGRDEDETQHGVTISHSYYMGKTEVTVGQFRKFISETGYRTDAEINGDVQVWSNSKWKTKDDAYWDNPGFGQTDYHPVTCVSWKDANRFIDWLNQKENQHYRLPTEAEWEYAARAGSFTAIFWGDFPSQACEFANVFDRTVVNGRLIGDEKKTPVYPNFSKGLIHSCSDGYLYTSPVAAYKKNRWGLHDMIGNVSEWCQDWYGDYAAGIITDPKGPSIGKKRVLRGGSWYSGTWKCRSADRSHSSKILERHKGIGDGFRLAASFLELFAPAGSLWTKDKKTCRHPDSERLIGR